MADVQGRRTPLERALYGTKAPAGRYGATASPPRPAVTAWQGADKDAYWYDETLGVWRHCILGTMWHDAKTQTW